jgi:prepilin-type N-terminal cleavage/methylation domain-containing protein
MKSGLYGWLNKNMTHMKGRKGQQGFTLIELLVVVTILGVLSAIVTLSLVGLTTNATVKSCNTEYKTVQAALDAYMANQNIGELPGAQGVFTNDMTGGVGGSKTGTVTLFNSAITVASPYNYTRNGVTQYYYKRDQFGKITAIGDSSGNPVNGCVPN